MAASRVAVMGAGAVGSWYGGMLARGGAAVTLVGRAAHVDAVSRAGLVIVGESGRDVVATGASTDASAVSGAEIVLVCVKSKDTADAARAIAPHLSSDAAVVSLQNGVANAAALEAGLGHVVLAAAVWVGAYMEGPGVVRHTGGGDLVLGATRAGATRAGARQRAGAVAAMFERAGIACAVVDDIESRLWHKLAINCAFNAVSALGRSRYGRMAREDATRETMEAAAREALAIARAEGIALDEAEVVASLWRTAGRLATQYSSTAQDILRGKRTEIDMLNGYVVERGAALGIATPVNRTLTALVRLREAGDDLV
jgi:2-dehydropantoate 2-reductase